jgi:mannosyltransferase OCH1-like enzyme
MSTLPPGSWARTARHITVSGHRVTAELRTVNGKWNRTSALLGQAYHNANGHFEAALPTAPLDSLIPATIVQTHSSTTQHMHSWRELNPDYTHTFYNDADARGFIRVHFDAQVNAAYDALAPGAARADLWRYCIMYIQGGVYVDADCRCTVALREWLPTDCPLVVVADHTTDATLALFQAFLAAVPRHPLFKRAIDTVVEHVQDRKHERSIFDLCGPRCLGRCLNMIRERAVESPWSARTSNEHATFLRHQQYRDDSIWHHDRKVVQCQLPISRTVPTHRQQRYFYAR